MALIKCSECGNEISDKATACPKCGAPIEKKQEPIKTEEHKTTQAPPATKKNSAWKIIVPLVVVLLLGVVLVVLNNNPNALPGIKLEINTPKPLVVTSRADGSKSGLFKARTTVYATIQNQGGAGNVLVTFHVYQNGKDFDRSKSIFLGANQSQDLDVTFDEVKMLGGDITFNVEVRGE